MTWKINNFDDIRRSEELISSQIIRINLGHRHGFPTRWLCYLLAKKDENDLKDIKQVGIYVQLHDVPTGAKNVICSFRPKISKPNYSHDVGQIVKNFQNVTASPLKTWGWEAFITTDMESETILLNGSLVLKLELKLYSTDPTLNGIGAGGVYSAHKPKFCQKLQTDAEKMLIEPLEGSDVGTKIISNDGVAFLVNSGYLAARSPVFDRMFQSDMEDSRTGIINITDLSSETVKVLLHFLYTGTLMDGWKADNVIPELFHAAGKYQLPDLLGFLDEVAGAICSKENAGRLLGLARKLGLKQAEKGLTRFMRKHLDSLEDLVSFAEGCTASKFV